jgi:adenylate cyclase
VHYAARVAAQATGGEVVVSALTKAILETRSEIMFGEPRLVELKGLPGRHSIHPVLPGWLPDLLPGGDQ